MIKEQIEKIKSMIVKDNNGNNKKKIENLFIFIIILIVTLIIINYIWNDNKSIKNIQSNETSTYKQLAKELKTNETNTTTIQTDLEQKLENILSKIEGVGKVKVLITYSQSSEIIAMYNETSKSSSTQEEDSEGRNKKNR